jgi:hypothetical protein
MRYSELTALEKEQVEINLKEYCAAEAYLKLAEYEDKNKHVLRRMGICKERIIETKKWLEQNHIKVKQIPSPNILDFKFIFEDEEDLVGIDFYRLQLEMIHSL